MLRLVGQADDLNFLAHLQLATLDTAGSNRTTAGDGEYVLNRHQERLVSLTVRSRDIVVNSIHQLVDAMRTPARSDQWSQRSRALQSGTADDRNVVARELIGATAARGFPSQRDRAAPRSSTWSALVHEYNDIRNAYLTSKQDVLTGLRHRAVSSRNNQDRAVHLSSAGDHVLNIVGMARAVNVRIVTVLGLILNVSGVDRNAALSLFRRLIDVSRNRLILSLALESQNLGDRRGQRGLAMVNVADGTDVNVRLRYRSNFSFAIVDILLVNCNS